MRLLFTCRQTMGHFQPLLPLAQAAQRRGHDVVFAAGEPIAARARASGFRSESAGLSDTQSRSAMARLGVDLRTVPPDEIRSFVYREWFGPIETPPRLLALDRICADFRPDALVHETAELAGPLAAATVGIPWVTVGFGPLLLLSVASVAGTAVAPFWQARSLAMPPWGGLFRHLYVDPCPPALQSTEISALPARIGVRSGSSGLDAVVGRSPGASTIYVTFGTIFNSGPVAAERMRIAVSGCAMLDAKVVVTVGHDNDLDFLGPQPANVQVHRFIPQDELLPSCAVAVMHGGAGTLLGALSWGVPMLLLPQSADQFQNAECATNAGVGLTLLPAQASMESIAHAVRRLRDETSFAERSAQVRTELTSMPDVEAVVARIERI